MEKIEPVASSLTLTFTNAGQELFTIKADGTIERGPGFTTNDEMSLKFWEAVEATSRPLHPLTANPKAWERG